MALAARLDIRQGQGLVLTPQLQQAIKLLQLSNLELEAFVEAEIERNPLLQKDDRDAEAEGEAPPDAPLSHDMATDRISDNDATEAMDADHRDLYTDASPGERSSGEGGEAMQAGGQIDWSKAGGGGSFDADVAYARCSATKSIDLFAVSTKQFDEHCSGNIESLGHLRIHRCVESHLFARDILQSHTHPTSGDNEHRQHHERQHGKPPLERKHRTKCCYQHHHI